MSSVTFDVAVGGDGSTVTDDNDATTGLREGGWKTRFVPCFTQQVAVANYVVSAATSVLGGATTNSTSTTSLSIATGSKSLTLVESGKAYIVGQYVIIASTASPSNNMIGQITSFLGTSLVVNVTEINGSGTISAWSISVTGIPATGGSIGLGGISVFTSSGTYTIPSGATKIKVTVVGAGGGGGKFASGSSGGNTTVASGTQTISTITGGGGGGGLGTNYTPPMNDNGGVGTGGDINFSGSAGLGAYNPGGQSMFGNGGAAFFGGGGVGSYNSSQGGNGLVYGGGAGGTYAGQGGGGGGAAIKYLTVTGGNTLTVTIGAGGAGGNGTATGAQGVVVIEY
jgi:hypothetical protein